MRPQRQQPYTPNRPSGIPQRRSWWRRAGTRFGLLALGLTALLALLLRRYTDSESFSLADLWLIVINVVAFVIYGYDKTIAGRAWTRVPERLLLLLALVGGTVGALLAMLLFRHKTSKASFGLKFLLVILLQIALIVLYYWWQQSNP
ncbi:MAG TPA: DUF1294 domain-containing protein [Herpetosiphonaceae bacterium]